jgi:hypothetical protein
MFVDGDKAAAPANLLAGLGPFEEIVIVQELSGSPEVVCLHGCPESLYDLFAGLRIIFHV